MKLGIVISTDDGETNWNAFRLANSALKQDDEVKIFLPGQGVEYKASSSKKNRYKRKSGRIFTIKQSYHSGL